jgi:hypothetical protein
MEINEKIENDICFGLPDEIPFKKIERIVIR